MHLKIDSSQLTGPFAALFLGAQAGLFTSVPTAASKATSFAAWKAPLIATLVAALLAGCAQTRGPAPVEKRPIAKAPVPTQRSITGVPPAPVSDGSYRIKRGDTLIGIALDHGVSWRDIVAWNQLDNPNLIEVDQVLRVKPLPGEKVTSLAAAAGPAGTSSTALPKQDPKSEAKSATGVEVRPIASSSSAGVGNGVKPAPTTAVPPKTANSAASASPPAVVASAPLTPPASASAPSAAGAVASVDGVNWGWPGGGRVINQFADPGYKGIALSGVEGDPVVAASDGRVVYSGSGLRGYGNLVIVKHDADFLTAYAHNRTILVSEGQTVKRGQKIAELGKTDSDVPKLHFEVRKSGKPVDPMKFLPAR